MRRWLKNVSARVLMEMFKNPCTELSKYWYIILIISRLTLKQQALSINVIHINQLIQNKMSVGRSKDKSDIEYLKGK